MRSCCLPTAHVAERPANSVHLLLVWAEQMSAAMGKQREMALLVAFIVKNAKGRGGGGGGEEHVDSNPSTTRPELYPALWSLGEISRKGKTGETSLVLPPPWIKLSSGWPAAAITGQGSVVENQREILLQRGATVLACASQGGSAWLLLGRFFLKKCIKMELQSF